MRFAFLNSLLFLLVLTCTNVSGQSIRSHENGGSPFGLQLYSKDELPNQWQNWSIVQDKRGIIYAANHAGILEYDGSEWRLIHVADSTTAFSLAINEAGVVYAGARDDFGYLAPDSSGTLRYNSLLENVREEDLGFGTVWTTTANQDGIYFQANSHLFRWDGSRLLSWRSNERMHTSFVVNDHFYLKRDGVGLLEIIGDSLQLIPGGAHFADRRVFFMGELEEDVVIGAQQDMDGPLELHRLDETGTVLFPGNLHLLNDRFTYTFYHGSVLPNGYLALATLYDGVFIIDQDGELIETLDADRGVGEDVNSTYTDAQGSLWLAHNSSGISYIGSPIGLAQYGEDEGLAGAVNSVLRHKEHLYVATDEGLFRLKDRLLTEPDDETVQFDRMVVPNNSEGLFWSLLSHEDELLVAAEFGVFSLKNDQANFVAFKPPKMPGALYKSGFFDDRVYVGLDKGWGILSQLDNDWEGTKLGNVGRKVTSIFEASDGTLWLSTIAPGNVWRVRFDGAGNIVEEVKIISNKELGVSHLKVGNFGGEVGILALPKGVFRPRENETGMGVEFVLDEKFLHVAEPDAGLGNPVIDLVSVDPANYWTLYRDKIEKTIIVDGEHITEVLPGELTLPAWGKFREIYVEEDGIAWISNDNSRPLLRHDPNTRENSKIAVNQQPLIRGLTVLWADSVLYGGAFSAASAAAKFKKGKILSVNLPHEDNDLRFDYTLPNYNKQGDIEFRYFLNGHDEGWSKWTTERSVVYRNIEPGNLSFTVQASVGGIPIEETASITFSIQAPWFWTWWMKLFYLFFFSFSVLQFVRYQRAKKQIVLLNIERDLNARLQLANTQLRTANDSLEQANRMKDEFLANASHELRTPLTAILGFTSVLKEEVPEENLEFLGLIDENGKRLLQTINSLLDLAKLRAGMFELNFEPLDIGDKTEEVVDLLTQLAKNQDLSIKVEKPVDQIKVRLDAHCYERILYNLVGNAIKFTRKGGVNVRIERLEEEVRVHIIDTGVGIDEGFIPQLFDEFKQEPNNEIRTEGSGLGLTITAKLVELLDGRIFVKSEKGKGSTFTVAFQIDEIEWVDVSGKDDYHSEERAHSALQ